MLIKNQIIC